MTDPSIPHASPAATTIYVQQAPAQVGAGLATASLVLGVLSLAFVWIPLVGMIAWILAPLGLIFGLVALRRPIGRGAALAGAICSGIGLLACIGWLLLFGAAAATGDWEVTHEVKTTPATSTASEI